MPFPSEHQLRVIEHRGKPLIVVAGPGTGKTQALVERMISLLSEDRDREVVFMTFTRTSRRDTEEKLLEKLGKEALEHTGLLFPRTSTMHRYAKRFVHQYASFISRESAFVVPIESKGELNLIIGEVISDLDLELSVVDLAQALKFQRATTEWPPDFPLSPSQRLAVQERYDLLLALYKSLDMEGVVLAAIEIMEAGDLNLPQIFLQLDEYQDLNPIDHRFIDLVASHPGSEIVIVGDDAQSIYGFRHAHPEGLNVLWNSPTWERIHFPDSFRLPAHILNAALDLIADADYIGSVINRKQPADKRVLTLQCTTADLQVEATARHMSDLIHGGSKETDAAIGYGSFLVLCPTGDYARRTAEQLNSIYGIPAYVPSRTTIPADIWSIVLILRILANQDPLALRQWLPVIGLTTDEIKDLRDQALEKQVALFDLCLTVDDPRIDSFKTQLDLLTKSMGNLEMFLESLRGFNGLTMPRDLDDFLKPMVREIGVMPPPSTLIQSIYQEFGVLEEEEVVESADQVLVATMHAAKGLEADFVYCLWMNGRFMPMPGRDPEEERRVLYVALTRAKRDIIICFHEEYSGGREGRIRLKALSPYLREIIGHLKIMRMSAPQIRSKSITWVD